MVQFYSPEGRVGPASTGLAKAPTVLRGLRVRALDNGKPGALQLLTGFGERLAARAEVDFRGVLKKGSAATPCEDALFETIVAEADLVLTGTAD